MTKRTFLITGASSEIGRALARHLGGTDARLLLTTRRKTEFTDLPERASHLPSINLLQPDDLVRFENWLSACVDGPLTVVNCLGYFPGFVKIRDLDLEETRRIYDSNVVAVYSVARIALPIMARNGGGQFIAFSSHAVSQAYPLMAAFASAKAAVELLIRAIANEYSRDGITSIALAPATIDTPTERALTPHGDFEHWLRPEQICAVVSQLANDSFGIMNGNTVQLFNYSESYFGQSYFDRIGRKL